MDFKRKMGKQILWIRDFDCGHERYTSISFLVGNYEKPRIGEDSYCRTCWKTVRIVGVRKASKRETDEEVEENKELFPDWEKDNE